MDQYSLATILHQHDGSISKAAKHFDKHYSYIKYWVNKYNLSFKLKVKPINIDPKDVLKVYAKTQSTMKCGKHFGVSKTYIRGILHKYNVCNKPITYDINHRFFDKSNENEAQMYWAGFIAADGSVSDAGRLTVDLARKDREHLCLLKTHLNAENPIQDNERSKISSSSVVCASGTREYSRLRISSKKLCYGLARFNVTPRKTKIYIFPEWLANHKLVNHFMRGYLDGDGCISYCCDNQIHMVICGAPKFLTVYRSVLERECFLTKRKYALKEIKGCGRLQYGGNKVAKRICDFLYKDSSIYLDRKRDNYLKIL